jgi:hypothetical protein
MPLNRMLKRRRVRLDESFLWRTLPSRPELFCVTSGAAIGRDLGIESLAALLDRFRPWSHLTWQNTTGISQTVISSAFRDRRCFKNEN